MAAQHATVSRAHLMKELDVRSRRKLNISAEEFLERYRARKVDLKSPTVTRLAVLARLITKS